MMTFRDVIRTYAPAVQSSLGSDENGRRRDKPPQRVPVDAARLRTDLERVRTSYMIWFTICIGVAIIAMAGGIMLALNRAGSNPLPLSVSGLSTCALLGVTARLLKTRGQIDLLLTLAGALDRDALRTVVAAIRF